MPLQLLGYYVSVSKGLDVDKPDVYKRQVLKVYWLLPMYLMMEAAEMDSCGELGMLFRIALPLSKPMLSTVALFSALAYWNDWINRCV